MFNAIKSQHVNDYSCKSYLSLNEITTREEWLSYLLVSQTGSRFLFSPMSLSLQPSSRLFYIYIFFKYTFVEHQSRQNPFCTTIAFACLQQKTSRVSLLLILTTAFLLCCENPKYGTVLFAPCSPSHELCFTCIRILDQKLLFHYLEEHSIRNQV